MGKNWEKKEYESKQIASTFWWDSALFSIVLGIVWSVVAVALFVSIPMVVLIIISAIMGVIITLVAENIAIKKVRNRAIVKKEQVNEIVKKFAIKWVILLVIIVVVEYFSQNISISNLILWIVEAILGTIFAKKLLNDLAV